MLFRSELCPSSESPAPPSSSGESGSGQSEGASCDVEGAGGAVSAGAGVSAARCGDVDGTGVDGVDGEGIYTVTLVGTKRTSRSIATVFLSGMYIRCACVLSRSYPTQCPSMARASSFDPELL